jgi:hypothetical protein
MKQKFTIARVGFVLLLLFAVFFSGANIASAQEISGLRVAVFDMDITPPVGSLMHYNPVIRKWDLGLRARGIALLGAEDPIVLCAIDWVVIANEAHDAFRKAIADAVDTTMDRVTVHTVHQHDAPFGDFSTEKILKEYGMDPRQFEGSFAREAIGRLAKTVSDSLDKAQPVTHLGLGGAEVYKVASNRRILGPDGKVSAVRFSACRDPKVRAEPEGLIDPMLSLVSFWNEDDPVAVLSYYAVHPQSYYRTGVANPDFPGVARFFRQLAVPDALHVHFAGAGANLGAGKYNDGSHENRLILAERLADGMRRAWENTKRQPLKVDDVHWNVLPLALSPSPGLSIDAIEALLKDKTDTSDKRMPARDLAWLRRCRDGHKIEASCLSLGSARLLHFPGEMFVEYQLAAKAARPDLFVAMAAYGDGAPSYIGTQEAYAQGGYETSYVSRVAPETEATLMAAINRLLDAQPQGLAAK